MPLSRPRVIGVTSVLFGGICLVTWLLFNISDRTAAGYVVDAKGAPIAGVEVTLSGAQSATTVTDRVGRYSFPLESRGRSYVVAVSKPGYGFSPPTRLLTAGAADGSVDFTAFALTSVTWTNVVGIVSSGNGLVRPSGLGWNTGATSGEQIEHGDGFVEFTASETTTTRAIGISFRDSDLRDAEIKIDFALLLAEGNAYVYERGVYQDARRPYVSGDRFRIAVAAGVVRYYQRHDLTWSLLRETTPPALRYPLQAVAALNSLGATLTDIAFTGTLQEIVGRVADVSGVPLGGVRVTLGGLKASDTSTDSNGRYRFADLLPGNYVVAPVKSGFGFSPPVRALVGLPSAAEADFIARTSQLMKWTKLDGGVVQSQDGLTKNGGTDTWSAGAVSRVGLASAGGFMEFEATETITSRAVGLSFGDSNQDVSDIDFALLLAEGHAYIYEGGIYKGVRHSYATGDRFHIGIEDGAVRYYQQHDSRWLLLDESHPTSLRFPLLVDSSIYSRGATIGDVWLSGPLTGTLTISGEVIHGGGPLSGVIVTLSGSQHRSTTTDETGSYVFAGLPADGDYVVAPSSQDATFSPADRKFASLASSRTADFSAAALTVLQSVDPGEWRDGIPLSFSVTVRNDLSRIAENVTLVDALADGVVFQTASTGCGFVLRRVICDLGSLAPGQSRAISIVLVPLLAGTLGNTVTATSRTYRVMTSSTVEALVAGATLSVTNTSDTGPGSLRQAILDANAIAGANAITFGIASGGGATIVPSSPLPDVVGPLSIDGTTQPGFTSRPLIAISGANAGPAAHGLRITGNGSKVSALAISAFDGNGLVIEGGGHNVISRNSIGNYLAGPAHANSAHGVLILNSSSNMIGGNSAADGNRIVDNDGDGVSISGGSGNAVLSNVIHDNSGLSIRFQNGANNSQPAPEIHSVTIEEGNLQVVGFVAAHPSTTVTIQVFASESRPVARSAFAERVLGSVTMVGPSSGRTEFSIRIPATPATGEFIAAVATNSLGDSSPLSEPVQLLVDRESTGTSRSTSVIYSEDFATVALRSGSVGRWYYYPISDPSLPCGERSPLASPSSRAGCIAYFDRLPWWSPGLIESRGPWWTDPNHAFTPGALHPGLGYLNILGFVDLGEAIDLSKVRVAFRMKTESLELGGGHVYFWAEATMPDTSVRVNMALASAIEVDLIPDDWTELSFGTSPSDARWLCLGARSDLPQYGCAAIDLALQHVTHVGFIVFGVQPDPDGDESATGIIQIDDVVITRDTDNAAAGTPGGSVPLRHALGDRFEVVEKTCGRPGDRELACVP